MYIYDIFLSHLSVDGHVAFFHILAIVNSAAMNFGVYASFRMILIFSRYMPQRVDLLGHGSSGLIFLETSILLHRVFINLHSVQ